MARSLARCCAAVIGAAALTFTVIAVASQREAQADTVDVVSVSTTQAGTVQVAMGQDALWVQIDVLASRDPDATTLLTTDALTGSGDTWTTNDPVQLPAGTAYGYYPVDVDYRLDGGTVQHWSGVANSTSGGQLAYVKTATVATVTADRSSVDFRHTVVNISGSVSVRDPATGSSGPAPAGIGVQGAMFDPDSGSQHETPAVLTAADGSYSLTINATGEVRGYFQVVSAPGDTLAFPLEQYLDVPATQTSVRILNGPARTRVAVGHTVALSGTAQYFDSTGWHPLTGYPISSYFTNENGDYAGAAGSARTDSAGRFTVRFTARRFTGVYTGIPYSDLVSGGGFPTTVFVPTSASYSATLSLDMFGQVTARGHIHGTCSGERVALQRSSSTRGPWTTIGSGTATNTSRAAYCDVTASGSGGATGYYRISHSESDNLVAYTGQVAHLSRTVTRIISFAISPRRTSNGNAKIVATGRVQQRAGSGWKSLPKGEIVLVVRPVGESTWYFAAKHAAASNGSFRLSSKSYVSGDWGVYYLADSRHLYSQQSRTIRVTVS